MFGTRQIVFPVGEPQEGCMIGAVFESKSHKPKVGKAFIVANAPGLWSLKTSNSW